jgi:hypothetical protein
MMNTVSRLMSFGLMALIGGCASSPFWVNDDYPKEGEEVSDDRRDEILDDWYFCDECVGGELRRVQALGNTAVESLAPIVMNESAPDTSDVEDAFDDSCQRVHDDLTGRGIDPGFSVAQCVERYERNLQRRLRYRSIEALLAIRTEAACLALGAQELGVTRCLQIPAFPPLPAPPETGRSVRIYDP